MAEFNPQAIIRKLAEAEWPCRNCGGSGIRPPDAARVGEVHRCLTCYGGRYNVPFASLRVPCCAKIGHGWKPEPDVEKACWRVNKVMEKVLGGITYWIGVARLRREDERWWDAEECWLRAAEAWLDEQMKEVQP